MKNRLFSIFSYILLCAAMMLVACEKSLELTVSLKEVTFDAYPDDPQTIDISANVAWTAEMRPQEEWLTMEPMQGKGSATISFKADENIEFTDRNVLIIISGDGTQTDTIKVRQTAGMDVSEKMEDNIFRQYCLDEFDKSPKDGKLSLREVKKVSKLNVKGLGIKSLAGIEYFRNLTNLNCSINLLESIDISNNKELLIVDCSYNESLEKIDVSKNVKLTDLSLWGIGLTSIDVSQNTNLHMLEISNNPIGSLVVSNNPELDYLSCNETGLTKLDVGINTKLRSLYCANNQLSTLDVNKNPLLGLLWCSNNLITSLSLHQNPDLETLSCAGNKIENLDVSKNTMLSSFYCDRNKLTKLDVNQNTRLTILSCSSNNLTGSIDLSHNNKLLQFNFKSNPLLTTIIVWPDFPTLPNDDYFQIDSPPTYYK